MGSKTHDHRHHIEEPLELQRPDRGVYLQTNLLTILLVVWNRIMLSMVDVFYDMGQLVLHCLHALAGVSVETLLNLFSTTTNFLYPSSTAAILVATTECLSPLRRCGGVRH